MRRIANATYMSLDGVVQRPELWTFDYRSDDAAQVSHDQLFAADGLIMGRHTYDIFAAYWPAASDASGFADRMNTIPKYVLSHTLSTKRRRRRQIGSDGSADIEGGGRQAGHHGGRLAGEHDTPDCDPR